MQTGSGCIARTVSYGGGDSSDQNNQAHLQAYELVTLAHSTQQANIYSPFDGDRAMSDPQSLPAPLSHSPHQSGFRRKLYTPQEVARIQECDNASRWRNPPITVRRVFANLSTVLGPPTTSIKKVLNHLGLAVRTSVRGVTRLVSLSSRRQVWWRHGIRQQLRYRTRRPMSGVQPFAELAARIYSRG
jgi:hypothetical protein